MKMNAGLIPPAAIPLLVLLLLLTGCSFLPQKNLAATAAASLIQDHGTIAVHFCPQEACEQLTLDFIADAGETLHCALHDLNLESLGSLLEEKAASVDVRLVMDDHYIKKAPSVPVVADSSYGLMHNKFCVVDQRKLFTGSMNPTQRDTARNNNNLLFIESPIIARWYEQEFEELWNRERRGSNNRGTVLLDTVPIAVYFCPDDGCADKVVRELRKAQRSIHFMAFSFTHTGIANVLLTKHDAGIEVRGVFEKTQLSEYSVFEVLQYQGADVRIDGNPTNMHHKVFIVDGRCVLTGSMNPTGGGDSRNDENLLIICDEGIAQQFEAEFEKVWGEAVNAAESESAADI